MIKENISKRRYIPKFLNYINLIIFLVCLYKSFYVKPEFKFIVFIPGLYTLLFYLTRNKMNIKNPGMITLNLISFMRYSVLPLVLLLEEKFHEFAVNYNYINQGILLMIIEMMAIFLTIIIYHPKEKISSKTVIINSNVYIIFSILAAGFIMMQNRFLFGNLSIGTGDSNINVDDLANNNMLLIIWQALCCLIYSISIFKIYKSKSIHCNNKVIISLVISLLYILVIYTGQMTISRWYTIVSCIALFCLLISLYSKKTKMITLCVLLPTGVIILLATILKNTNFESGDGLLGILTGIFNSTNLGTYFAGPVNINTSIAIKEEGLVGIKSLFFDILNNFPSINHLIDRSNASVNIFNDYIGRSDQIIPLVGQSFIWFGYLGTPILSILSTMMVKKLDFKFQNKKNYFSFLVGFVSVWCALMPILNFTIWISWFYSRIIPAVLFLKCFSSIER